ncbi:hypothetical protein MNEG_11198 [Monoraphidium neglectum]|uniref:Uncharacterized protein n=1 Tax=Monoraphidium neglectum TaxID=145388 RepID=A0A0D2LZF0_9CHLO|nr:hypothetical protein MNEG_11198 [Monoraphidium neglectum]KIY96764.1 hypothetical protein MNEG_11198 [Monoraphidium neglectum]|eukprot:XP_013895784.1 hypothetical protein MNEG_11198 [Monoraphidium neglectum]
MMMMMMMMEEEDEEGEEEEEEEGWPRRTEVEREGEGAEQGRSDRAGGEEDQVGSEAEGGAGPASQAAASPGGAQVEYCGAPRMPAMRRRKLIQQPDATVEQLKRQLLVGVGHQLTQRCGRRATIAHPLTRGGEPRTFVETGTYSVALEVASGLLPGMQLVPRGLELRVRARLVAHDAAARAALGGADSLLGDLVIKGSKHDKPNPYNFYSFDGGITRAARNSLLHAGCLQAAAFWQLEAVGTGEEPVLQVLITGPQQAPAAAAGSGARTPAPAPVRPGGDDTLGTTPTPAWAMPDEPAGTAAKRSSASASAQRGGNKRGRGLGGGFGSGGEAGGGAWAIGSDDDGSSADDESDDYRRGGSKRRNQGGPARGQANGGAARQQQDKRAAGEELEQQLRRALTGRPMAPQPLSPDGAPRGITAQGKYSLASSVAARLLPTLHLPLPWVEAGRTPQIHAAASLVAADAAARSALGCSSVAGRCVVEGAVGGSHERRHYTQHVKFTGALLQRLAGLGAVGCRLEAAAWRLGPGDELMLEVTVIGPAAQQDPGSAGVASAGPRTPSAAPAPGRGSEKATRRPRGSEGAGPAAPAGGADGGGARGGRDQAAGAAAAAAAAGSPAAEGGAVRGGGGGGGPAGGADFSPARDAPKVSTMAEMCFAAVELAGKVLPDDEGLANGLMAAFELANDAVLDGKIQDASVLKWWPPIRMTRTADGAAKALRTLQAKLEELAQSALQR